MKEALNDLGKLQSDYLPEITVIEYLLSLESPVLQDLHDYLTKIKKIPCINLYNGNLFFFQVDFLFNRI